MTFDQISFFAILCGALLLFAWGRWRYDLVAVMALLAAVATGIVPSHQAFAGFGHPAVITVAAVLVLSASLSKTGLVQLTSRWLQRLTDRPTMQVGALGGITAACSAIMNNVGACALMLPIALQSAAAAKRPASHVLMPVSFASLLGGLITLIGTPPNIIIAGYRRAETGAPFGMFDFAPVGLAVSIAGIAYIAWIGWRILPTRPTAKGEADAMVQIEGYFAEVRLPKDSRYVGRRIVELESLGQGDIAVVALQRRKDRMLAPSGYLRLQAGDILMIESSAATLERVVEAGGLEMVGTADLSADQLRSERVGLAEVVVTPGSRMEGRTASSLALHTRYGVNLLGMARQGQPVTERLGQARLVAGDVLLLQGERETMPEAFAALGCLPLAARTPTFRRARTSPVIPLIFGGAILLLVSGLVPAQIAFVAGALAMVLTGQITLRELYESIDWPIIVLLGAMIPVGMAFESTGATAVIADPILSLGGRVPAWTILALLMVITMLLSDIMNNAATAVLMAPIGISIAHGLGAAIDPFLMAVAIGSSCTFLTPIGHQSNLLVMGPGGYGFGDYWRMGLPLDVIIVAVGVPAILYVWPL